MSRSRDRANAKQRAAWVQQYLQRLAERNQTPEAERLGNPSVSGQAPDPCPTSPGHGSG